MIPLEVVDADKPGVIRIGNEYVYVCPGQHGEFDLTSYGSDGQPGGAGENADICNWAPPGELRRAGSA